MNACIRAVVRTALHKGMEVHGIRYGYDGMINDDFFRMHASSVANIIHRGGTILKTARSKAFMTEEGMKKAAENISKHNIEGMVAIGGDGTFRGALAFREFCNIPIIGCPGTIDNDLFGTDFTIGFDTALNTVVDAVDKIRDTAESHNRIFVVEVMGRDSGLIALYSGIGVGAEGVMFPETRNDFEAVMDILTKSRKDKKSKIIIVAEGDEAGGGIKVAEHIRRKFPDQDVRVTILGHIQRGGAPSCMERVNASRMGHAATVALKENRSHEMVGIINGKIEFTPFNKAVKQLHQPDPDLVGLTRILAS